MAIDPVRPCASSRLLFSLIGTGLTGKSPVNFQGVWLGSEELAVTGKVGGKEGTDVDKLAS